jgi:hypothetical protein
MVALFGFLHSLTPKPLTEPQQLHCFGSHFAKK